jgi:hypothetical protein
VAQLVARLLWEQEVASSNLAGPTITFMKKILVALALLALPVSVFAEVAPAGTDAYLKDTLGWSTARLTTPIPTEGRQPFDVATGEGTANDPLGDVLSNFGVETSLNEPWGDIAKATLAKDQAHGTWDFQVTLGGDVPATFTDKAVLFVYADADGNPANDSPDLGVKLGMDSEWSIQHNAQKGWYTAFRWYNPAPTAKVWAVNKTTKATFKVAKDVFAVSIPFAEMPATATPHWRVAMAIQKDTQTEIDVAPTVGFPDAKSATPPAAPPTPSWTDRLVAFISQPVNDVVLAVLVLGAGSLVYSKRKKLPPSDPQP